MNPGQTTAPVSGGRASRATVIIVVTLIVVLLVGTGALVAWTFLVVDGVGGQAAGARAAEIAVEAIRDQVGHASACHPRAARTSELRSDAQGGALCHSVGTHGHGSERA